MRLKFFLLNCENLFILSDEPLQPDHLELPEDDWQRLSSSVIPNKPLAKIKWLRDIVREENPDILLLTEVGGSESLAAFNKFFLDDGFTPFLEEGNSDRHIDVGFLVKKHLAFSIQLKTNKDVPLQFNYPRDVRWAQKKGKTLQSEKFSRDVAELSLYFQDQKELALHLMLTHLKSQLDPDGQDPFGYLRRRAEVEKLVELYLDRRTEFGANARILVAGDFNGSAAGTQMDSEFASIAKTDLKDIFSLTTLTDLEKATFFQVGRKGEPAAKQLDYVFASSALLKTINKNSIKVYRYKNLQAEEIAAPESLEEKFLLPSDHYPIVFDIDLC